MTLLQYRLDMLFVAAIYPPELVAFYAIGVAAQSAVLAVGQSTGMLWFARGNVTQPDRRRQLRSELIKTSGISLAAAIPVAATSDVWVPIVYGEAFVPAVPVVAVLCCVGVVQSLDYLLAHECLIAGLGTRTALWRLPSLVAMVLGLWTARHLSWPVAAVAAISGVGYALSSTVFHWTVRRQTRVALALDDRARQSHDDSLVRDGHDERPRQREMAQEVP